jgi:hypothetical protein
MAKRFLECGLTGHEKYHRPAVAELFTLEG